MYPPFSCIRHQNGLFTLFTNKSNEILIFLNKSSNNLPQNGSSLDNSPTLINIASNETMGMSTQTAHVTTSFNKIFEIEANVTVDNNIHNDTTGSSFSSIENTRRSLLGESILDNINNMEELEINNRVLKALNILERVDNMEIEMKSFSDSLDAVKKENKILIVQ